MSRPMSRQQALSGIIQSLREAVPELQGVMVASTDGQAIVHDFSEADALRIAAMAATALGVGKRIAQTAHLGDFHEAVVRADRGYLIVYSAGEKGVLAVSASASSNLGLIHLESRGIAEEIAQLL